MMLSFRINGTQFQQFLDDLTRRLALEIALKADLARLFGLSDIARVVIIRLSIGSLMVDARIDPPTTSTAGSSSATPAPTGSTNRRDVQQISTSEVEQDLNAVQQRGEWLSELRSVYSSATSETIALDGTVSASAGTQTPSPPQQGSGNSNANGNQNGSMNASDSDSGCVGTCLLFVAAGVVAVVLIIVVVATILACRKRNPEPEVSRGGVPPTTSNPVASLPQQRNSNAEPYDDGAKEAQDDSYDATEDNGYWGEDGYWYEYDDTPQ